MYEQGFGFYVYIHIDAYYVLKTQISHNLIYIIELNVHDFNRKLLQKREKSVRRPRIQA